MGALCQPENMNHLCVIYGRELEVYYEQAVEPFRRVLQRLGQRCCTIGFHAAIFQMILDRLAGFKIIHYDKKLSL